MNKKYLTPIELKAKKIICSLSDKSIESIYTLLERGKPKELLRIFKDEL